MMFQQMNATGFDTSQPLKWRYTFMHDSRPSLDELRKALTEVAYTPERLQQTASGQWLLEVSKVEVHTLESLHERNCRLEELVLHRKIKRYAGWRVDAG